MNLFLIHGLNRLSRIENIFTIQIVVGTEDSHIVCLQDFTDLIERCTHLDAHCLYFVASGHDTAVIVTQNNDRFDTEQRIEHALA